MNDLGRFAFALLVSLGAAVSLNAQGSLAPGDFRAIDSIVDAAVAEHQLPGAVIVVGTKGHIVLRKAYGQRSLEPTLEPMTVDTIFDMASLTKPLITATAVMQLLEQGRIRLEDPVARYIPAFASSGKESITIANLLTHYSGLAPDLDLTQTWHGKESAFRLADASQPLTPPGIAFRYSDINFLVLQQLVETLTHLPLDIYAQSYILGPLGMRHSGFLPPADWIPTIAPTEYDEHHVMLRGVVHDPTARRMGGVAGDAGFFSTADDLSLYAQALLDRLNGGASRYPLTRLTLTKMTRPGQPPTGTALRGFGWDIDSPYSGNRGDLFPVGSFGHTGFTGTSLWIDPFSDSYVIILANGVHPRGGHALTSLRGKLATAVAAALYVNSTSRLPELTGYNESLAGKRLYLNRNGHVLTGIDVLEQQHFSAIADLARAHGGHLRTALLTNQTGLDAQGRSTADVLLHDAEKEALGFSLVSLFSPEHGIHGTLDQENIASSVDQPTGLPIISLYGAGQASHRPTREQLNNLDAVIVDLQDVGVRFYTYETLLGYFLEASAESGIQIIVLDRPNPITGSMIQGPVSDAHRENYTNYMPLPVRHGLTLGELAGYFSGEKHLGAHLTVIKLQGWERGDWFDSTGLEWTNPSPNLRSLIQATLYPGVALLETTNVSVGRGTDTPFEEVGAPWIDGRALAALLNSRLLPGIRFVPLDFTPNLPYPFAGKLCHGITFIVTDRNVLDAPEVGLELIAALTKTYPTIFQISLADRLLVNSSSIHDIMKGLDPQTIAAQWQAEMLMFASRRQNYLLY